ncbi:MAG: bifunctional phosphopantothenoylcysteine decarboxylase/phosphopantothenate--cysteine ligase CoaBC [Bacteroidales bacterium]|nr:bifunctional phosphopantothenoylcysteine decarboxylase/phosphopantothenate--cysteine ligase CoaBC [Bacteroidales bacterium]
MKANVVIAISGGIAAYKIPFLIRLFRKAGHKVKVVVTKNALNFVTEATLQTLSDNLVYSDMFAGNKDMTEHISIADWADYYIVAPATANIIGKYANAIADDCISTTLLAFDKDVFLAPAMNTKMYANKGVQNNLQILASRGVNIISPNCGELACGANGEGRMAEPEEIFAFVNNHIAKSKILAGKTICVTAGPTYEQIDPVRFIGNNSSGKMGFAIAESLAAKGASVKLIAGPTHLNTKNCNIERIDVKSAEQMYNATVKEFEQADVAILSAAVADYTPKNVFSQKVKKADNVLNIELQPTKDILAQLGRMKTDKQTLVGFALETNDEENNAKQKLSKKNLDFIVLNSLNDKNACFGFDTNKVTIIDSNGNMTKTDLKSKSEIAEDVVSKLIDTIKEKESKF